jgi:hypothetical protein
MKDMTLEEAWSEVKPSIVFFRVFGCVSYVHIPDEKKTKLNNKIVSCVLLRLREELKAYKLYNPAT